MEALLRELQSLGVSMTLIAERIHVKAPPGSMTEGLRSQIRESRDAIVEYAKGNASEGIGPRALPNESQRDVTKRQQEYAMDCDIVWLVRQRVQDEMENEHGI